MLKRSTTLFILSLFICATGYPGESAIRFGSGDRLLVIAPHPDDEALGAAGVMQQALAAGAAVKVLYMTHGELNEISSIFYQKRPLLLRSDFVKNGQVRKKEALEAMAFLRVPTENLIFLGYPDGGLINIWFKYWGNSKAFRSFFTRINKVPYKDNQTSDNPYKGDSIVRDLERALLSIQPTAIFVTPPFDLNHDHQASYLYLQVALMNVREQLNPAPKVYLYTVHAHHWPSSKKYLPDAPLEAPTHVDWSGQVTWTKVPLTSAEVETKKETILKYPSQIAYKKGFLLSFARSNEIFSDYPTEKLTASHDGAGEDLFQAAPVPGDVRYRLHGEELWVEIPISSALDEMGTVSSYVFGYRKGFLFSEMPKYSFKLFGNKLFAYEGFKNTHDPELVYKFEKDRMFIRIPLKLLKDPDVLFVSTRNAKEELSLDMGSWRMLEIQKNSLSA